MVVIFRLVFLVLIRIVRFVRAQLKPMTMIRLWSASLDQAYRIVKGGDVVGVCLFSCGNPSMGIWECLFRLKD